MAIPTPTIPTDLAEIIALHKEMFGGWVMEADGDGDADGTDHDDSTDSDDEQLGDAGKKALQAERDARKQADKDLAALRAQLKEYEDANKTEAQKLADAAATAQKERDTYAAELASLRREQAIYRNAGTADPAQLLDSRSFLDSIADIDPGDDKAIKAAIAAAVKDNPRLARVAQSTGDLGAGHKTNPSGAGINDLLRAAAGRG